MSEKAKVKGRWKDEQDKLGAGELRTWLLNQARDALPAARQLCEKYKVDIKTQAFQTRDSIEKKHSKEN